MHILRHAVLAALTASAFSAGGSVAATKKVEAAAPLHHFEFRGHTFGEPVEVNFPYWNEGFRSPFLPFCNQERNSEKITCEDHTTDVQANGLLAHQVGDAYIDYLKYVFADRRLIGLWMSFKQSQYDKIRAMLIGKYGPPTRESVERVSNNFGATFDNPTTEWVFAEGNLKLQYRFPDLNTSFLLFENAATEAQLAARRGLQDQASGKKAF